MSSSGSSVPKGHVALVLLREGDSELCLQIPSDSISSLCLTPRKYLLFLGWCILGVEGVLALEHDGDGIDTDGDLDDQEIYHYVPVAGLGVGRAFGTALHIIPYKRGSERTVNYSENVTALRDINDIRNGVFANTLIRNGFDPRFAAVLKTSPHATSEDTFREMSIFLLVAVILLVDPGEDVTFMIPNNNDAAFKKNSRKPKPSDLLLHYNYGAAALKCWGRGLEVLQNRANPPRPPVTVPAPTGPSRTAHDRETVIRKFRTAWDPGGGGGGGGAGSSTAGAGTEGLVESEGQAMWDEDDAILFFWGNSQAAKERHLYNFISSSYWTNFRGRSWIALHCMDQVLNNDGDY
ncbi:hypothetical protein JOM56_013743 [Amanita muscaria]